MDPLEILDTPAALRATSDPRKSFNGRTIFYIDTAAKVIYLHFETSYDDHLLQELYSNLSAAGQNYFDINAMVQSQFAKVFMFAASVCHLLVLTDPGTSFNSAYLPLFRALSSIREHKFLKYAAKTAYGPDLFSHLGKELRLCAPKLIFLFERPEEMGDAQIELHEVDMEHDIYSTLKAENLLSKNTCLFVLPKKLPFVHVNRKRNQKLTLDPVAESMEHLRGVLQNYLLGVKSEEIVEPHVGYGRPFRCYSKEFVDTKISSVRSAIQQKKHSLPRVIRTHLKEILAAAAGGGGGGVNGEGTANKSRTSSIRPNIPIASIWLEVFEGMYEMLHLGDQTMDNLDPEYVSPLSLDI